MVGKAAAAVADVDVHSRAVPGGGQPLSRSLGQLRDALDRVNFLRQLGENGRLVAGARADVEHALAAAQCELLADASDHVRLRDRLPLADRQRRVVVCAASQLRRHEQVARHASHRF